MVIMLLRVQTNGLKKDKIYDLEPSAKHSVKPSKGQAQSSKEERASHFMSCPKQPLQSNGPNIVNV
jgi:hypothetical protein